MPKQLVNADTKNATITEIASEKDVPDPTGPTNDIRFVEAQPAPTPLDSPALMAATTESELQPLSDDLVPQDGTDDLLTDILAESVLAGPLL